MRNLIKKISRDKKSEKDIKIIDNGTVLDRNKGDEAVSYTHLTLPTIYSV